MVSMTCCWSMSENSSRTGTSSGGSLTKRSWPSTTSVSFALAFSRSFEPALVTMRCSRLMAVPPRPVPHVDMIVGTSRCEYQTSSFGMVAKFRIDSR